MANPSDAPANAEYPPPRDSGAPANQPPLHEAAEDHTRPASQHIAEQSPVVHIRTYTLADIPAVVRMPGRLRLDLPDSLAAADAGAVDLPAALPFFRRSRPTFVAEADGHPIGFARFSPRRPDGRWILSAIAASTGVYAPEPVWDALLAHGVRNAGLRSVRRLFARVPIGHSLLETFRSGGWTPYAREKIYRAVRLTLQSSATGHVRPQEPADTWAIHQLYAASVPRKVQEIEALTSHVWHMDPPNRRRRRQRRGWVADRGGPLAGYVRRIGGANAGMVSVIVPAEEAPHFGTLLDVALGGVRRGRPVYVALRGYQSEFAAELTIRGFAEVGEQELLIRYTTAPALSQAHEPVLFPVELRPAMPRRVPTFLEGQPMDGMV